MKGSGSRWIGENSVLEGSRRRWIDENSVPEGSRRRWIDENSGLEDPWQGDKSERGAQQPPGYSPIELFSIHSFVL